MVVLLLSHPAFAAIEPTLERVFGATNVGAVAGHGTLTAGISSDGDVTVLSWPGPTFANQVDYLASNAADARSKPHFGADDGMGSFLGLFVTPADGPATLTWLRDAAWTKTQGYATDDSPVPVTTFSRADLGLEVTVTDAVLPDADVLSRVVTVKRSPGSVVTAASLVVYENLSPTLSKIPEVPVADWLLGNRNDFAAVWDDADHAIVHFHPGDRGLATGLGDLVNEPVPPDYGAAGELMKKARVSIADATALVDALDADYPPGVFALVTTEPAPASFQVGTDATPFCARFADFVANLRELGATNADAAAFAIVGAIKCGEAMDQLRTDEGWQWAPADALAEVEAGPLSGSPLAAGQTNGALVTPLAFAADTATAAVDFAFGATLAKAKSALAAAASKSPAERVAASEAAAHAVLAKARLPDASLGARVVQVARRALVNLYVARDRSTGAFAASITRQPPYHLDWPRDGAFDSIALDVAGLTDWVTVRDEWYATLPRPQPASADLLSADPPLDPDTGLPSFPAGAWEMNYFADGTPGGPIRFEIDNTALHVYATVVHAATLAGEARASFARAVWPSDKAALELLLRWTGPDGLPAPANEDDHTENTSTLDGAAPVYAALVAGARLANLVGDQAEATACVHGAASLRAAMLKTYFDSSTGLFRQDRTGAGGPGGGATAWMIWPARLLDPGDPRLEKQLVADMTPVLDVVEGKTDGGAYVSKTVLSAALYGGRSGARAMATKAVQLLAGIARPGTDDFGEVFLTTPGASGPTFTNEVATPHVWEGVLFYLSAMALSQPKLFTPEETALPLPGAKKPAGCTCGDGGSLLPLLGMPAVRRRRPPSAGRRPTR